MQPQAFTEHLQPRHEGPDSQQTISLTKKIALIFYEQTLYTTLLYTLGRKYELITKFYLNIKRLASMLGLPSCF